MLFAVRPVRKCRKWTPVHTAVRTGRTYVLAVHTAVRTRPYTYGRTVRTARQYVRLVRTGLGMIGMLAECSSLPCGELLAPTADIAQDSDIPTIIWTLPILKIAVAYRSNRAKLQAFKHGVSRVLSTEHRRISTSSRLRWMQWRFPAFRWKFHSGTARPLDNVQSPNLQDLYPSWPATELCGPIALSNTPIGRLISQLF